MVIVPGLTVAIMASHKLHLDVRTVVLVVAIAAGVHIAMGKLNTQRAAS